jgi:hypothetical protein
MYKRMCPRPEDDQLTRYRMLLAHSFGIDLAVVRLDAGIQETVERILDGMVEDHEPFGHRTHQVARRWVRVLRLRYGLLDRDPMTYRELAVELGGISQVRVRQIMFQAFRKLHRSAHSELLYDFIDLERLFGSRS